MLRNGYLRSKGERIYGLESGLRKFFRAIFIHSQFIGYPQPFRPYSHKLLQLSTKIKSFPPPVSGNAQHAVQKEFSAKKRAFPGKDVTDKA